jgi:hypothetical protein
MREVILYVHFDGSPLRRKKIYRKALKIFDGINWINRMSFLFYPILSCLSCQKTWLRFAQVRENNRYRGWREGCKRKKQALNEQYLLDRL